MPVAMIWPRLTSAVWCGEWQTGRPTSFLSPRVASMVEGQAEPSATGAAAAAAAAASASALPTSTNPLTDAAAAAAAAPPPPCSPDRQEAHDAGVAAEQSLAIAGEIIASVSSRERELEAREAQLRAAIRNNYDKIQSVEAELMSLRRGGWVGGWRQAQAQVDDSLATRRHPAGQRPQAQSRRALSA